MPKPKRGPQRPLTPQDLRDALAESNRDIVGHFTRSFGLVHERLDRMDGRFGQFDRRFALLEERLDRIEREVHDGFQKVQASLDATLELFPTRKEVSAAFHRLSRILKSHGIEVEPETLLPK